MRSLAQWSPHKAIICGGQSPPITPKAAYAPIANPASSRSSL
ncbi:acetyltransferase [Lactobacillus delbrueckii]|nr:acetyltransferase [Pediococcus acidilactici]MBB1168786.1 acetyltransferase [Lacticaseibacillus paracasei]MCT2876658.1 acetyltransferase [Lactobacillus delbrueckii]